MKFLLAVILSLGLAFNSVADQSALTNDCVIVATEAHARLAHAAWTRILMLKALNLEGKTVGHAVVVWQIFKGGTIYVYDANGSFVIKTRSHEIKDLVSDLNNVLNGRALIIDANFAD